MCDSVDALMTEWMAGRMAGCVDVRRLIEWMSDWMSECMQEWMAG